MFYEIFKNRGARYQNFCK